MADCQSFCATVASLTCPNDDLAECETRCRGLGINTEICPMQSSDAVQCLQKALVCDSYGKWAFDATTIFTQCTAASLELLSCGACEPRPNDSECDSCSQQNCCSERKAHYEDPLFRELTLCMGACGGPQPGPCVDDCNQKHLYPEATSNALSDCEAAACNGCDPGS